MTLHLNSWSSSYCRAWNVQGIPLDSRLPIIKSTCIKYSRCYHAFVVMTWVIFLCGCIFVSFPWFAKGRGISYSPNSSSRVLQSSDVNVDRAQGAINITITYSKTDQMGKRTVLNISGVGEQTCPFDNTVAFLRVRPNITGPFFCHLDSSPLTRYQFTAILSTAFKMLKLSNKYTSHSFRIGASTELALRGFSSDVIQKSGRWRSSCYRSYIRIPQF